jgi:hypothetical protein
MNKAGNPHATKEEMWKDSFQLKRKAKSRADKMEERET